MIPTRTCWHGWLAATSSPCANLSHGNVIWVMGGPVAGGKIYGEWPGLDDSALHEGRDLAVTPDYRTVLAQVCERHLELPDAMLSTVFPSFAGQQSALNIIKA
jgi:uncharacterized protein (DUF1501 family)